MLDANTGFLVRDDLCTGCRMCVLACSAIKQDSFSFSNVTSLVEITEHEGPASFGVRFTDECDGCSYCLEFCGFGAIEKPDGWAMSPRLKENRERLNAAKRARAKPDA
jgi:Fe-S-cluster-containing dehydrogenase component